MAAVLAKAMAFVSIIAMGYGLKKIGFFHAKDFYLLSKIVVRITLPAAIVSNFSRISMDMSLLVFCVICLLYTSRLYRAFWAGSQVLHPFYVAHQAVSRSPDSPDYQGESAGRTRGKTDCPL